jgi:diadenosine tetraphosphatase ApaH/serine/threonine PP2A family protein phosphatase
VGHTHQPYVLEVGDKLVINPGSVGQPRDGDPRAAFAVIEDNRVDLRRAEYPVDDALSAIVASTLPADAKEQLAEALRTGNLSPNGQKTAQTPNGQKTD